MTLFSFAISEILSGKITYGIPEGVGTDAMFDMAQAWSVLEPVMLVRS